MTQALKIVLQAIVVGRYLLIPVIAIVLWRMKR